MSKYIIDIPDNVKKIVYFHLGNANAVWTTSNDLDDLEQLNSDYINEHFGDLQDTAYQKGINDGSLDVKQRVEGAYQKGFEDGKAVHDKGCEGCKYQANGELTCPCSECANNFKNQWTAKDDKIEVGDEVRPFYTDITGVVTLIDGDTIYVLWRDGSSTSTMKLKEATKTGRHFDIATILEDMRND